MSPEPSHPSPLSALARMGGAEELDRGSRLHQVVLLETGEDALLARLHLLQTARTSIDVQTFIFADDDAGRLFFRELIRAAERGVKVRLLVDHFGITRNAELVAAVASASPSLQLKVYNCLSNKLLVSAADWASALTAGIRVTNQRMHSKLFLVDGWVGITGGRNYENDYYDRGATRNFRDRDAIVFGTVVGEMQKAFDAFWDHGLSVDVTSLLDVSPLISDGKPGKAERDSLLELDKALEESLNLASLPAEIQRRFVDRALPVRSMRFVWDAPGKTEEPGLWGSSATQEELHRIVSRAESRLLFQSPYLVLDDATFKVFADLRRRRPDLDVRIGTNSLASTDNLIAYALAHKDRRKFLEDLRFRVFELKPVPGEVQKLLPAYDLLAERLASNRAGILAGRQLSVEESFELPEVHLCLHAKTYLVDEDVWIGSYNLDPRSAHLNTEVGLILEGREIAAAVQGLIERDLAPENSWTVGRAGKRSWRGLFEKGFLRWILRIPGIKFWPFRYAEDYELVEGGQEVPFHHPRFHENYLSVGSFPEVPVNTRDLEVTLVKAFLGFLKPLT